MTTVMRWMLAAAVLLAAACAKPPSDAESNAAAKTGWDVARSAGQLDNLRDRAVLVQTDR